MADSPHPHRFYLPTPQLPEKSTVRKLVRRLGAEAVAELTRVVIGKAQEERPLPGRRVNPTVVEADIHYRLTGC